VERVEIIVSPFTPFFTTVESGDKRSKMLNIKNHTTRDGIFVESNAGRIKYIGRLYRKGLLKFRPYKDGRNIVIQTTKDTNIKRIKEALRRL